MPSQGEIYCHETFKFTDNTIGKKLIVVLNNPGNRDPCIFAKTTSQERRYNNVAPGCSRDKQVFYIPVSKKERFDRDTFIQLYELFEISVEEMVASTLKKEFYPIGKLTDLTFRQLRNCVQKCKDDISERHYKMIFK